jgi:hypothetical protein
MVGLFARIAAWDKMSSRSTKEETIVTLKNDDPSGDVAENKGPLWKKSRRSGNVYENTGAYPLKAGMLLKIKEL